ncbi:MAG TPA: 3D domain-containing protein [Chondromyces sp.]|nr:3D domain-containing protein [Chondromyces sp.]
MKKSIMALFVAVLMFAGAPVDAASQTYTVKKGDTLWKIAREYKTSVDQLKKWNNLKSNNIAVGKNLIVSADSTPKKTTISSTDKSKEVVKELRVSSSAYTANCKGCSGITATGINLKKNPNAKVIAVDPKVIPLGTKVYVEGYGEAVAGDKGGAIKGNKIDVHMATKKEALNWGRRTVTVKILK